MIGVLLLFFITGLVLGATGMYIYLEPALERSEAAATAAQIRLDGLRAAQRIEAAAYLTERQMYHTAEGPADWRPGT